MNSKCINSLAYELKLDVRLIKKLILTEDKRFFNHIGIDIIRIFGALISNVKSVSIKEGASTLTQQVYDIELQNISLKYKRERIFSRKIKQILFAIKIEQNKSKKEILEYYLKNVYLGGSIFGFKNASKSYFNHYGEKLSYSEIIFLLKRVKRPNDMTF